jgi:hypothetical protein
MSNGNSVFKLQAFGTPSAFDPSRNFNFGGVNSAGSSSAVAGTYSNFTPYLKTPCQFRTLASSSPQNLPTDNSSYTVLFPDDIVSQSTDENFISYDNGVFTNTSGKQILVNISVNILMDVTSSAYIGEIRLLDTNNDVVFAVNNNSISSNSSLNLETKLLLNAPLLMELNQTFKIELLQNVSSGSTTNKINYSRIAIYNTSPEYISSYDQISNLDAENLIISNGVDNFFKLATYEQYIPVPMLNVNISSINFFISDLTDPNKSIVLDMCIFTGLTPLITLIKRFKNLRYTRSSNILTFSFEKIYINTTQPVFINYRFHSINADAELSGVELILSSKIVDNTIASIFFISDIPPYQGFNDECFVDEPSIPVNKVPYFYLS